MKLIFIDLKAAYLDKRVCFKKAHLYLFFFVGSLGQTVTRLMTQCNEKAFELEVSSILAMLEYFLSNQFISKIHIFVSPLVFWSLHCACSAYSMSTLAIHL